MSVNTQPLAARMRPSQLGDIIGQQHLLGPNKPLRKAIELGHLHSMILWGPPGTGKTTLANLVAQNAEAEFQTMSAVLAGVKEIRAAIAEAENTLKPTVLFIDEVHRFNKGQQDALLPHVENGVITLIGATTENPSFELNNALLSRARVYVLKSLQQSDLLRLINSVLTDPKRGYGDQTFEFSDQYKKQLAQVADGDARFCLNLLEILVDLAPESSGSKVIDETLLEAVLSHGVRRFDKGGDLFYDQISALHKSVRGSDPDASLYWFARMIEAGCDPLYIARRVVRMASEDVGNADPRALTLALQAWEVQERLGSPEGELAIAQAIIYCAVAAKSNAVYVAYEAAMNDAKNFGTLEVPMHLRNAPTKLMKTLGHGKNYRYAHDEPGAFAAGENYLPEGLPKKQYYQPVERGLEIKIAEKLRQLAKQS